MSSSWPGSARQEGLLAPTGVLLVAALGVACGGEPQRIPREPLSSAPAAGRQIDPPAASGALAPNLALVGSEVVLSWLEPLADERHRLLISRFDGAVWAPPTVVAEGGRFFANWADLPAVAEGDDGSLVAHWLAKTDEATYAYSPFLARSVDGGATWSDLGRLDDDDTPTEHGFVSYTPEAGGVRAFWLDGREMEGGGDMSLRTALIGATVGASEVLDARVCECCSTDAVRGAGGPLVVYRDRSGEEVRDISVVLGTDAGWTTPSVAAEDDWTIAGCPVNGPAVDAGDESVVLAWFTGAGDAPRVQTAFSGGGGASFTRPTLIDDEGPAGRVDVVLDGAGGAVVSWLAIAGDTGSVRLRRVAAGGQLGEPVEIAVTSAARASGFPRLVRLGETLYLAWVDTGPAAGQQIRAREIPLHRLPAPA